MKYHGGFHFRKFHGRSGFPILGVAQPKKSMSEPEKQPFELRFDIPPGYREGERLDVYLTRYIQNATRAKVQKGIKEGMVMVNGDVITKGSRLVQAGDRIDCVVMKAPSMDILPEAIDLDIRYEDDDVIVVNKAAGMVVHPAFGHRTGTLVHALLHHVGGGPIHLDELEDDQGADDDGDPDSAGGEESATGSKAPNDSVGTDDAPNSDDPGLSTVNLAPRYDGDVALRPGIVHRLDKDTSGLLVVAKNDVTHASLSRQFANRETRRRYLAILWGIPDEEEGTIQTDLARDVRDRRKMATVKEGKGKHAITHYKVVEHFGYTCLAEFRLETGRTHQIRVHAAHLGHAIFGDTVYGGDRIRKGKDEGQRRAFYANLFKMLPRQALHAASLGFRHPATGAQIDIEAELPDDMVSVIERLRSFDIVRM